MTQQPINIFVPLDTIRDYIYVDDAAVAVTEAVERSLAGQPAVAQVLVIASGQPTTVGQLLRTMNQVTKRRVPVALGTHPSAYAQSLDLRLVPTVPLSTHDAAARGDEGRVPRHPRPRAAVVTHRLTAPLLQRLPSRGRVARKQAVDRLQPDDVAAVVEQDHGLLPH